MPASISSANVSGTTIDITGTGGVPGGKVGVYLDGALQVPRATPNGSGNWTLQLTGVASGGHELRAADIITTSYSVTTQFVAATATIGSAIGPVTEDVTPQIIGTVTNPNGGIVEGLTVNIYYRISGATTWLLSGLATTDENGDYVYDFVQTLPDGLHEFRAEVLDVIVQSAIASVTVSKPNEAPNMPPSYNEWILGTKEAEYGYIGGMMVGASAPNGTVVGTILPTNVAKPPPTYALSGETAGFTINASTGQITVSDSTLLSPGTRNMTITASNAVGSDATNIQLPIVSPTANGAIVYVDSVAGSDANDGRDILAPRATFSGTGLASVGTGARTFRVKRGSVFTTAVAMVPNRTYEGYGDPSAPQPHINTATDHAMSPGIVSDKVRADLTNITIKDLHLSSLMRPLYSAGGSNWLVQRVRISGNVSGVNRQGMALTRTNDLKILNCHIADGVWGDGMYLLGCNRTRVGWNYYGAPASSAADNIQVTTQRSSLYPSSDTWIHDNTMINGSITSSKGCLVVEGTPRALIEGNYFFGKYFCMSSIAAYATIRNNIMESAISNKNSFGLAIGGPNHTGDQSWYDNFLTKCQSALSITGYGEGDYDVTIWQRYDVEINDNIGDGNVQFYKQDRALSGYVQYNVGQRNNNNAIAPQGGALSNPDASMGDEYTTKTLTPNFLNSGVGPVLQTRGVISGTVADTQTVTVTQPVFTGAVSYQYQWRLNGKYIPGATVQSYTIANGSSGAVSLRVPTGVGAPSATAGELSCVTRAVDADGNYMIALAQFSDGSFYKAISA